MRPGPRSRGDPIPRALSRVVRRLALEERQAAAHTLSDVAVAILRRQQCRRVPDNPLVFPSRLRPGLALESLRGAWTRAKRAAGLAADLRIHDLRHSFASALANAGEKNGLPTMGSYREHVEAGGLMAYGIDIAELLGRMAEDVHEILKGAKPGDVPIYQSTKFEFVINLKTAKALGVTLPLALLARADEIIE